MISFEAYRLRCGPRKTRDLNAHVFAPMVTYIHSVRARTLSAYSSVMAHKRRRINIHRDRCVSQDLSRSCFSRPPSSHFNDSTMTHFGRIQMCASLIKLFMFNKLILTDLWWILCLLDLNSSKFKFCYNNNLTNWMYQMFHLQFYYNACLIFFYSEFFTIWINVVLRNFIPWNLKENRNGRPLWTIVYLKFM